MAECVGLLAALGLELPTDSGFSLGKPKSEGWYTAVNRLWPFRCWVWMMCPTEVIFPPEDKPRDHE